MKKPAFNTLYAAALFLFAAASTEKASGELVVSTGAPSNLGVYTGGAGLTQGGRSAHKAAREPLPRLNTGAGQGQFSSQSASSAGDQNKLADETAPVIGACAAPAGLTCDMSPVTDRPPVKIAGGPEEFASIVAQNIPFDMKWVAVNFLTYMFNGRANTVQVHPMKFSSARSHHLSGHLNYGHNIMGAYISLAEHPDPGSAGTWEAVISEKPGSMTPVKLLNDPKTRCGPMRGLSNTLYVSFIGIPKDVNMPLCPLKEDVQYYLNVKAREPGRPFAYIFRVDY